MFLFRKNHKRYLYRAIDEDGVVVDVLLREHRDTASAEAFFRQAIERTGVIPDEVVTDHHQPYVKAVATTCPGAQHIRTGLHRARGETTKAIERSHVPMRDRLRNSRGLKRTETGQRFLEGFEAVRVSCAIRCARRARRWGYLRAGVERGRAVVGFLSDQRTVPPGG